MTAQTIPDWALRAYEKGCAGKDSFPSENAANASLAFAKRGGLGKKNGDGSWDALHAYECGFCGEWHLGH